MLELVPEDERKMLEQAMRYRTPIPDKIKNAPELHFGLELYWGAFFDLNTCRQVGMGIAPIPWTSILEYAMVHELDSEATDDLFYFVRTMDHAYIEHHSKQTKKEKKDGKSRGFQ